MKKTIKTLESTNIQKNKLSKEVSETLLKNKLLLKQMKQILSQSNNFSCDLMKIIEEIREFLKKINQWPEDFEQKQLENLSFNLIDSQYLDYEKISNFSHLNELKKVIDCLIKSISQRENVGDIRIILEENEFLKKNNQKLQLSFEEIKIDLEAKEEFLAEIQKKFIEVRLFHLNFGIVWLKIVKF